MSHAPRTLAESDRLIESAVRAWTERADDLVGRKVGDAAAHARNAVTAVLVRTPDGRPTHRRAAASRPAQAAQDRLGGLLAALAGNRKDSLDGLLRDARGAFYRDAFDWIRPYLVDGVHRLDGGPTQAGESIARGAVIHGYDLRSELAGAFDVAARTLSAAVNLAGGRHADPKAAELLLSAWEDKQRRAISSRCKLILNDSARALLWAVEQALVDS